MGTRAAALAALLIAIGTMVSGCSGGQRAAPDGARTASGGRRGEAVVPAASAQPRSVRCGETAVAGRPLGQVRAQMLSLPGTPDGLATTPDGRVSFVAIQTGIPRIAVIKNGPSGERLLRTVVVPSYASGMTVTPDGRYALGAAARGAVVLDVAAAISGVGRPMLGSLATPARVVGHGQGAAEVAVSPDSRYAFLTLEGAGIVAVFHLDAAVSHGFGSNGFVGSIPVGDGALGVTASPDGRWLYEVSEGVGAGRARGHGTLTMIDLRRAEIDPAKSVVATAPVACAPVRVAVPSSGRTVWVTARDGNALLRFSAVALRSNPTHALVSVTRVGEQPLGLAVADGGRIIVVADSNLSNSRRGRSAVSVVDTSSGAPILVGSVPSGHLADAISTSLTGKAVLVTNSGSKQLEVLALRRLP
jgi:DNA-binding beta-propeller fold protein YncE